MKNAEWPNKFEWEEKTFVVPTCDIRSNLTRNQLPLMFETRALVCPVLFSFPIFVTGEFEAWIKIVAVEKKLNWCQRTDICHKRENVYVNTETVEFSIHYVSLLHKYIGECYETNIKSGYSIHTNSEKRFSTRMVWVTALHPFAMCKILKPPTELICRSIVQEYAVE